MAQPPTCMICRHERAVDINRDILNGNMKQKAICEKWGITSHDVMWRHLTKHLATTMKKIHEDKKVRDTVTVYEELLDQLDFAKSMRIAAQEYLSDPKDPLRMMLLPRASEVEVVYYDYNELSSEGIPTKKSEKLQDLLAMLSVRGYESDRVIVKHVDIRKFALDTIASVDLVLDKFSRIEGLYQKDRKNAVDIKKMGDRLYDELIALGWSEADARAYAANAYTAITPTPELIG